MNAENLAKMSIPAVLDSGCLAPSLMYLHTGKHETITGKHTQMYEEVKRIIDETQKKEKEKDLTCWQILLMLRLNMVIVVYFES